MELIQVLRRHRFPVTAGSLAGELGVSTRTLYRDIETLRAEGAPIEGEAGLGYVLLPGFLLPPLMFSEDEIEALALGLRWVVDRTDGVMALAARDALGKISAVLPQDMAAVAEGSGLLLPPGVRVLGAEARLPELRRAIRAERKVAIAYADKTGRETERVIWPFALAFFEAVRVVAAWCELRTEYRAFRADRITFMEVSETRYPRRRHALMQEWKRIERVPGSVQAADRN
ncbi:MAG: YafY family transcriptional regulator [Tabrizicola sp.]|nr:YafY family transcriptional regulator [Tabrizicola sp.]